MSIQTNHILQWIRKEFEEKYLLRKAISIERTDFSFRWGIIAWQCVCYRKPKNKMRPERRLPWSWVRGNCLLPTQSSWGGNMLLFRILPPTELPCFLHLSDLHQQWVLSQRSWKVVAHSEHLADQQLRSSISRPCTLPTASGRESTGVMEDCQENQVFRLTRSVAASHSLHMIVFSMIFKARNLKLNIIVVTHIG